MREEGRLRGLEPTRENLIRIGNELREQAGPGALAERVLSRLTSRAVVDSIRNPAEVEVLRRLETFLLIGIRSSVEMRFRRSLERARPGDPGSLEQFKRREAQENSDDPNAQQLGAAIALADHVLPNHDTREELARRVLALLGELDV